MLNVVSCLLLSMDTERLVSSLLCFNSTMSRFVLKCLINLRLCFNTLRLFLLASEKEKKGHVIYCVVTELQEHKLLILVPNTRSLIVTIDLEINVLLDQLYKSKDQSRRQDVVLYLAGDLVLLGLWCSAVLLWCFYACGECINIFNMAQSGKLVAGTQA